MNRIVRAALPLAVALATLAAAAHAVHGLASSCWAMRADDGSLPECCRKSTDGRVERQRGCCGSAWVADALFAGVSEPIHDLPGAPSIALAAADDSTLLRAVSLRGFRPRLERPPDRSPPTRTIVLLL